MTRYFDNTRISTYRQCPRKFFFRHVLDWRSEGTSSPLAFGAAWHSAMDLVWSALSRDPNADTDRIARAGYAAFLNKWEAEGMPSPEDLDIDEVNALQPRAPMNALEMLYTYISERRSLFFEYEILDVERPFAVPLDPKDDTLWYVGRLDKRAVRRDNRKVHIFEHKTTSAYKKDGYFKEIFTESFSPNTQVDGYLFVGHMISTESPDGKVDGLFVDGALVHKTVHEGFCLIPVKRSLSQLNGWLWETHEWIRRIEADKAALQTYINNLENKEAPGDYMPAFPKNTGACWDFMSPCPFLDLCKMWPNPIGKSIPQGYVEDRWSPFDVLELEKIGMPPEKE